MVRRRAPETLLTMLVILGRAPSRTMRAARRANLKIAKPNASAVEAPFGIDFRNGPSGEEGVLIDCMAMQGRRA
jgi:hypothetical protein